MTHDVDLFSLRFGRGRGRLPPVGALSLAASLERCGISCEIVDTQLDAAFNPCSVDALANRIGKSHSPILAMSVFNDAIPLVVAAFDQLGDAMYGRRVFLGGPGVVGIPEVLLARLPCVEGVIVGEGETAFPLAIRDPDAASYLPGVFTRGADGVIKGHGRTARQDLDQLAPVRWQRAVGKRYSTVPWSTMRGCPFECQFCEIVAFMGRRVTMRSVPSALEDLGRAIDCLQTRQVDILDDTFTVSKKRVLEICTALRERRMDIRFSIFSRTDTLDEEMMHALAEAGCERVFFGIDGGDDEILEQVAKHLNIRAAERTIRTAAGFFEVTASFIWGYPFESVASFSRMLDLADRLRSHSGSFRIWPQLHLLSPSAGTPLFQQYSDRLKLDCDREVLPLGRPLRDEGFRRDYCRILEIVRSDKVLAAPFWHYETEGFTLKAAQIDEFNRELDRDLGAAMVRALSEPGAFYAG